MLWDIKLTDFRMTEKKNKLWEDQGGKLDKTADYLNGWFKSLRDNYTHVHKKKSGDGVPDLTEREQWVKDNFSLMKAATRHRPEPVNSVKVVTEVHPGNLIAAEAACEELADTDAHDRTPSPTLSSSTVRMDKKARDEDILQSLPKECNNPGSY
ncbi:hypothetical protein SNE40_016715 [Patella caerulea]|uniref:MADF domain-containing protein n=2 Tax=Patella caerulea TaxID=87958 RepID=A0AAN8JC41_PATCE